MQNVYVEGWAIYYSTHIGHKNSTPIKVLLRPQVWRSHRNDEDLAARSTPFDVSVNYS